MKVVAVALLSGIVAVSCASIECSFNSDCGDHARCEMNICTRDCLEDRDCTDGATCDPNGFCFKPTPKEDRPEIVDDPIEMDLGSPPVYVGIDAGIDAGFDAGFAVGRDVGRDSGFDVGRDVGIDVGIDIGMDVGRDVGFDVGAPDVPAGPAAVGVYEYTGVRPEGLAAPVAVAWHPLGGYALILSATNTVFRYNATARTVALVGSAGTGVSWRGLAFTPDGARALLLGNAGSGTAARGRLFVWDHASSMLGERAAESSLTSLYLAIHFGPDGRAMLLGLGANSLTFWRYDASGNRTGTPFGYGVAIGTGCNDLAWVRDRLGDPALMVVCGINTGGILSVTGLASTAPVFATAVSSARTGNTYRIAARPQGDAAITIGSTNKLYRYRDAVWTAEFTSPFLAYSFGVAFSWDGARALAFGGPGRAYEYRYDLYSRDQITDVSIALSAAPFVQPSTSQINDVAWRPGCHEGLAVGGSNTLSGVTAFVAYFRVLNGAHCTIGK